METNHGDSVASKPVASKSAAMIYHAALPEDWAQAETAGSYQISTRGVTLAEEGFIHCSNRSQVEGVANRYYEGVTRVLLLTLDRDKLGSPVIDETPAGSAESYPHIYGPIPIDAVAAMTTWEPDSDGIWRFPTDL